ncbi:MAG: hypothetical protein R3A51_08480 [Nannocystaceae bacterium]|nr:hypothetical protein [Myxococcales bacterium]
MADPVQAAILATLDEAAGDDPRGSPMGVIVDALVRRGFRAEVVELAIWGMMARRQLTPSGFVCRFVRRRDAVGELVQVRSYEFLLVPWAADMDRQLELAVDLSEAAAGE